MNITEDYVSYETAKLLKEKGFIGDGDVGCKCGFYKQNKEYPNQINLVYDDLNNSELECNECLRFTHQMAMKYLRKVYGLHITIKPYITTEGIMFAFEIYNLEEDRFRFTLLESKAGFEKSEEAVDAAIKCCLTNLILNYYENIERI